MAVLELDFDAPDADEVAPPLDPVIDDFHVRNDVTVARRKGSSARAVDEDGPMGVDAIGRYEARIDVNTASDEDLPNQASWHLILGTVEGARYPQVTVDLDAAPASLVTAVSAVGVGDLIRLLNLPDDLDPQLAELIILGYSESSPSHRRLITFNTTPASPYAVGVAGDESTAGAWSQTGEDTQLVSALASGGTSALVHSDGPLFTTDATELVYSPLEVVLGGEVCPVPSSPSAHDTFTRNESGSLGTATSGQAWTITNNPEQWAVDGSQAVLTIPTGNEGGFSAVLPDAFSDLDMRFTVRFGQVSATAGVNAYPRFRHVDINNYYRVQVRADEAGFVDVFLQVVVAGSVTTLASAGNVATYSADSDVYLHVQAHGARLRCKVWTGDADLPPNEWTVEEFDSTFASGQVGIRAQLSTGNTNTNPKVKFDDLWVGEAAIKSAGLDTFTRTTASGWGTSDYGHTYALSGGSASDYSTDGDRAAILVSTASVLRRTVASGPSTVDGTIRGRLIPGVVATGNSFELGFSLRRVDGSNYYSTEVRFLTAGALSMRFIRTLAGSASVLAEVTLPGTYSASTEMWLVFQVEGSALRAKAWDVIRSEPTHWQLERTDTNITDAGLYGCELRVQSGNSNVPFTLRFDDLELVNPQTIELTRTVAKTHTAGTIVQVSKPLVASL